MSQVPTTPVIARIITDGFIGHEPLVWNVGDMRPDGMPTKIIRIFETDVGIDIYHEGSGMYGRDQIPWSRVRDVQEMMSPDVFAQELTAAQEELDAPEEDNDETTARPAAQRHEAHA